MNNFKKRVNFNVSYRKDALLVVGFLLFIVIIFGLSGYFHYSGSFITGAYAVNKDKLVSPTSVIEIDGVSSPIPLELVKVGEDWYYNITSLDLNLSVGKHIVKIIDNSVVVFEQNVNVNSESNSNFNVSKGFGVLATCLNLITGGNCNIDSQGSYTLSQNIVATYGINVRASNVSIDCQGYKISYGDSSDQNGYGINIVNWPNVTIKNCVLNQSAYLSDNDNAIAINISGSDNSTITNITAYCYRSTPIKDCIAINSLNRLSFSNVMVYANGRAAVGINLVNNSIFDNITTVLSGNAYSVNFTNSINNSFLNSRFSGITNNFVSLLSNNASILNSYFYSAGLGLSLMNSYNWNLSGNSIYNITRGIYALNISSLSISGGNISATGYSLEIWNSTPVNISNIWLSKELYFNRTNVTFRNFYLVNNSADALTFNTNYYIHYDLVSINGSVQRNTTNNLFIQPNLSSVVIANLPEFNVTANLSFFVGASLLNRVPTNTTAICNTSTCLNYVYNSLTGISTFDVLNFNPGFTNYSIGSIDLSVCNNITYPGSYYLLNEVQSSSTCINITSSNVVFDCRGYKINYSNSGVGYGVVTYSPNTTIKNCVINQTGTSSNSHGIFLTNSPNSTVSNNTITTSSSGNGVHVAASLNSTILNNMVTIMENTGYGIQFNTSHNSTASNNVIVVSASADSSEGIRLFSHSCLLNNNTITTFGLSNKGIYIIGTLRSTISNNIITTTGASSRALYLDLTSNFNILSSNVISSQGSNAVYGDDLIDNNLFQNNIIKNSTNGFYLMNFINLSLINNSIYNVSRGLYIVNATNLTVDGGNISSVSYSIEIWNSTSVNISNVHMSRLMFFNNTNVTFRNVYVVNNSADAMTFNSGYYILFNNFSINSSVQRNTTNNLFIQPNLLGVVSENLYEFNTSANLSLFVGTGYSSVSLKKNGADCSSTYCMNSSYNSATGYVTFKVDYFSNYSAVGSSSSTPAAASTSSGAGGGNAAGASKGVSASNMWAEIVAGQSYEFEVGKSDIAIDKISFMPLVNLKGVKIGVNEFSSKPSDVSEAPGNVYKYLEISETGITNDKLQGATIIFSVVKAWVDTHGGKNNIILQRLDGSWAKLATSFVGEINGKYQYTAVTSGFSYFAITGQAASAPAVGQDSTPIKTSVQPSEPVQEPVFETPKTDNIILYVAIGGGSLLLLIIIIIIVLLLRRKKDEVEEESVKTEKAKEENNVVVKAVENKEVAKAEVKEGVKPVEAKDGKKSQEDSLKNSERIFGAPETSSLSVQQVQQAELEEIEHIETMCVYINQCLKQGIKAEEAKLNLLHSGWSAKEVNEAIALLTLQDFIKKYSSSFPKEKIVETLLNKGWSKKLVNEAYRKLE